VNQCVNAGAQSGTKSGCHCDGDYPFCSGASSTVIQDTHPTKWVIPAVLIVGRQCRNGTQSCAECKSNQRTVPIAIVRTVDFDDARVGHVGFAASHNHGQSVWARVTGSTLKSLPLCVSDRHSLPVLHPRSDGLGWCLSSGRSRSEH